MRTSGIAGSRREKLDALTSLRFFAAAMIVAGHGQLDFGQAGFSRFATSFPTPQGVSLFFVLSGFVLSYAYPTLHSWSHVARFWWARFARIWPAHAFALILLVAAMPDWTYLNLTPERPLPVILANLLMVHAWIPVKDYYESLNVVSWSISTEFFFYFTFPFLIHRWSTTWHWKLVLVIGLWAMVVTVASTSGIPVRSSPDRASVHALVYIHPLTRLLEFTTGILAFSLYKRVRGGLHLPRGSATAIEVLIIALALTAMWVTLHLSRNPAVSQEIGAAGTYWLKNAGSFPVFAVLIVIFALQRGWVSRVLRLPLLVLLGEISYSLYLVHTYPLRYLRAYLKDFSEFDPQWLFAAYWLVAIVLSYLMYSAVEKPARAYLLSLPGHIRSIRHKGFSTIRWRMPREEPLATTLLAGILVFLVFFTPSSTLIIPPALAREMVNQTDNLLQGPVRYEKSLELLSLRYDAVEPGQVRFLLAWRSLKDITPGHKVALHFLNGRNQMVGMANYIQVAGHATIPAGTYWREEITLPRHRVREARKIGLVLFVGDSSEMKNLLPSDGPGDWGRRRLIIPLGKVPGNAHYGSDPGKFAAGGGFRNPFCASVG